MNKSKISRHGILTNFTACIDYFWVFVLKTRFKCAFWLNFSSVQDKCCTFFAKYLLHHECRSRKKGWSSHRRTKCLWNYLILKVKKIGKNFEKNLYLGKISIGYYVWCDSVQNAIDIFIFNSIFDQMAKVIDVNPR